MTELLHPVLFVAILVAIGLAAHVGLRRARRRFDEASSKAERGDAS